MMLRPILILCMLATASYASSLCDIDPERESVIMNGDFQGYQGAFQPGDYRASLNSMKGGWYAAGVRHPKRTKNVGVMIEPTGMGPSGPSGPPGPSSERRRRVAIDRPNIVGYIAKKGGILATFGHGGYDYSGSTPYSMVQSNTKYLLSVDVAAHPNRPTLDYKICLYAGIAQLKCSPINPAMPTVTMWKTATLEYQTTKNDEFEILNRSPVRAVIVADDGAAPQGAYILIDDVKVQATHCNDGTSFDVKSPPAFPPPDFEPIYVVPNYRFEASSVSVKDPWASPPDPKNPKAEMPSLNLKTDTESPFIQGWKIFGVKDPRGLSAGTRRPKPSDYMDEPDGHIMFIQSANAAIEVTFLRPLDILNKQYWFFFDVLVSKQRPMRNFEICLFQGLTEFCFVDPVKPPRGRIGTYAIPFGLGGVARRDIESRQRRVAGICECIPDKGASGIVIYGDEGGKMVGFDNFRIAEGSGIFGSGDY